MGEGLLILCVCVLCFSCVSVCACVLGICELLLISVFTKWPVVDGLISLVWCFLLLCVFSFCHLCLFFMYCFYSLMILKKIFKWGRRVILIVSASTKLLHKIPVVVRLQQQLPCPSVILLFSSCFIDMNGTQC